MNKFVFWLWLWLVLLIVIHTLDMELTNIYIGNNWQHETFLPMSICIKYFGIYPSLWISRIIVYSFVFMLLLFQNNSIWRKILITITILYWASMVGWLYTLDIVKIPNRPAHIIKLDTFNKP